MRPPALQDFYDALDSVLLRERGAYEGRHVPELVLAATHRAGAIAAGGDAAHPFATSLAHEVLAAAPPGLEALCNALSRLVPHLHWNTRQIDDPTASPDFNTAHANAVIHGRKGFEYGDEVTIGLSLTQPGVVYPVHTHPPEELYLPLTPVGFFNVDVQWQTRRAGETFYNTPGIRHAMRAVEGPMMAIWMFGRES